MDGQITMEEYNPEYAAFVEKFKPKKTTDDCYTPENIYNAVRDWVLAEYKNLPGGWKSSGPSGPAQTTGAQNTRRTAW